MSSFRNIPFLDLKMGKFLLKGLKIDIFYQKYLHNEIKCNSLKLEQDYLQS